MPSINELHVPLAPSPRTSSNVRAPRRHTLVRLGLWSTAAAALGLVVLHVALPFPSERLRGREYTDVSRRTATLAWAAESAPNWRVAERPFLALEDLSPWVPVAIVAGLDPLFHEAGAWRHLGELVDFEAASGRSLAREVAQLLEPEHTLRGGLFDAWRVYQLERALTRNEILEEWLDRTDFGGGSVGLQAAARHWFGCAPDELTLGRSALLTALSDPQQRLELALGRTTLREQRDTVLATLLERGAIDSATHDAAHDEPLGLLDHRALAAMAPQGEGNEVSIAELPARDGVPR